MPVKLRSLFAAAPNEPRVDSFERRRLSQSLSSPRRSSINFRTLSLKSSGSFFSCSLGTYGRHTSTVQLWIMCPKNCCAQSASPYFVVDSQGEFSLQVTSRKCTFDGSHCPVYLMITGLTATPGQKAPDLNSFMPRPFEVVPSGQMSKGRWPTSHSPTCSSIAFFAALRESEFERSTQSISISWHNCPKSGQLRTSAMAMSFGTSNTRGSTTVSK
mmetsp:Transcript_109248/g.308167  ORF Transcript_109248/g.308167 Transcript_109248/m.308167 type:complete len:215 (+) Transcript_109248:199-843(+)